MFRHAATIIMNDTTLMVFAAQLQRSLRTRSTRRIQRRMRLLLRLHFFSKRHTQRLHAPLQRCPGMNRYVDALQRPFAFHDYYDIMKLALNESFGVPHLGRAAQRNPV